MKNSELKKGPLTYRPEIWRVEKDTIYAAIPAVKSGVEYARECLATHETAHGRTTLKNKTWAETMERDIRHMERTLEMLRACGPNDELCEQETRMGGTADAVRSGDQRYNNKVCDPRLEAPDVR